MCIYIYIYTHIVYIYIYRDRERERERLYICIDSACLPDQDGRPWWERLHTRSTIKVRPIAAAPSPAARNPYSRGLVISTMRKEVSLKYFIDTSALPWTPPRLTWTPPQ